MGRKSRRNRSDPPRFATAGNWHTTFIPMFRDMIESKPYIALSAPAKEVYMIIRNQYKGEASGDVVKCPYSTFVKYGVRRETAARAVNMLEAYGFIEVERGGLEHRPNEYRLSEKWKMIKTEADLDDAEERFRDCLDIKSKARERKREFMDSHAV